MQVGAQASEVRAAPCGVRNLHLWGPMRTATAIFLSALLAGCGLGYRDRGVDTRPERAMGVGATVIEPGQSSAALGMPASPGSGTTQSSTSSGPGSQSGSSRSTGSSNAPDDDNLTLIGGQSGKMQESQKEKLAPPFLPLLGYPFWLLGKNLEEKTDSAVEREAQKGREPTRPEMPAVQTPDDVERERLRRENAELRDQLRRQPESAPRAQARLSIADELAALEQVVGAPRTPGSRSPLPAPGLSAPELTDRNADGRADLWTYRERDGRVREAVDEDHDGRVDKILTYDAEHRLERSEEDLDGDGVLETVTLFRDGVPLRRRTDSDANGQSDAWSFYRAGELERHEIDRDGDGFRDLAMSYEGGQLVREEEDRNGDGRPDHVTLYRDGQIAETREDLDFDGTVDVESVYENGKLARRDLHSARALESWGTPP